MYSPLDLFSMETWILLLSAIVLIRFYIHKRWQFLKNMNVPHDPPSILGFGHLGDFIKDPDCIFNKDVELKKRFGPIYGSYVGFTPYVTIADTDILKQIHIKEFSTFPNRQKSLTKIQGKEMNNTLTATQGEQWKRIRNTLTPTFSGSKLKEMIGIIEQCSEQMVRNMKQRLAQNEGRFDTKEIFGRYSLDVVCSAAFSANVQSQIDEKPKIVEMAQKAFNVTLQGSPVLMLLLLCPWLEKVVEKFDYSMFPKDMMAYYRGLTDALIAKKKDLTEKQRVDLMQLMLNAEISEEDAKKGAAKGLTKNEIVGNSIIMILAGYENTANAMVFLSYNFATHKDVQKKVQQEIEDCIKKYGGLTYEGVNNMKYLSMCINESLRLYTPIARNARIAENDITINGFFIQKGMTIQIPVYGLCHDDEYWDEPFKFKPERMEDMSQIDPMTFLPFGAGPRNCIGLRFALMEIKMGFCKVLQEFDLDVCSDTPQPPLQMTFKASMKPKEDIFLKLIPRA